MNSEITHELCSIKPEEFFFSLPPSGELWWSWSFCIRCGCMTNRAECVQTFCRMWAGILEIAPNHKLLRYVIGCRAASLRRNMTFVGQQADCHDVRHQNDLIIHLIYVYYIYQHSNQNLYLTTCCYVISNLTECHIKAAELPWLKLMFPAGNFAPADSNNLSLFKLTTEDMQPCRAPAQRCSNETSSRPIIPRISGNLF